MKHPIATDPHGTNCRREGGNGEGCDGANISRQSFGKRLVHRCAVAALLTWTACVSGWAAQTTTWEMAGPADFLKGTMRGVAVTWDGILRPGLRRTEIASPDQPVIWSAVRAADGTVYLGTGYRGAVYAVRPSGQTELLWTAQEPVVFALTLGKDGALYAGTSPNGKIYRIQGKNATEYYDPKAQYIWSMTAHPSGKLYIGTGPEGLIHEVSTGGATGTGEVYYSSGQAHITSLAVDGKGNLLAGSEPNGLLYRVTAKDKAFVLHDSDLPEIRAIVPAADGTVYVAAMGGSVARKQQIPAASSTTAPAGTPTISATVTVTAATPGQLPGTNAQQPAQLPQPTPDATATNAGTLDASASAIYEMPGVERSAVYRVTPDNLVEKLWSSKEENVYDLVLDGERLLAATDREGRIYAMDLQGRANVLAQTEQGQTTKLLVVDKAAKPTFLAATGNEGKLFRFETNGTEGAEYESPVHDAQKVSRWGQLHWRARREGGDGQPGLELLTRSGSAFRPDDTWSEWQTVQPEAASPASGRIASPNARYLQWKLRFRDTQTSMERVTVAYLPQNGSPKLESLSIGSQLKASSATGAAATLAAATAATAAYTVTVSASGEADSAAPAGSTIASTGRMVEPVVQCTWQAEDPDGDTMTFQLAYRAEDEREWKVLAKDIHEMTYAVDGSRFADGRYYFQVTASDDTDNPEGNARQDVLVSAPAVIDHGAPELTVVGQERLPDGWRVRVKAADAVSLIRRLELSINAQPFVVAAPVDGISDSTQEEYALVIPDGDGQERERSVVVRATDAAGNVGTLRLLLRKP